MTRVSFTAFIFLSLSLMLLSGCSHSSAQTESRHDTVQSIVHTTIAVVNADMGVELDGERLNYSASIIATLDADYTLVSPVMAESGFESGAYGAIIKFPSDVSEKILSFNSHQPERVQLEFRVNKNLSESDYVDTNLKIMTLQVSINTTLAYTFVGSIYRQFHIAQDQLEFIFRNNLESLLSMDIIRLPAFSSALDLDELPEIPLETEGVDTAQHKEMVEGFAEMVSSVYISSYEAASQTYLNMREGMFGLIDELPGQENDWLDKLLAWAIVKIEYSNDVSVYTDDLEEYSQGLKDWLDNVYFWYGDASDWHTEQRTSYTGTIKYINEIAEYIIFLTESIEPVLYSLQTLYDLLEPSLEMLHDWRSEMLPVFNMLRGWLVEIEEAIGYLDEWYDALNEDYNELEDYLTDLGDARGILVTNQADLAAARTDLNSWYTALSTYVTNLNLCTECAIDPPPVAPGSLYIPAQLPSDLIPELPPDFEITPESEDLEMPELPKRFRIPKLNRKFKLPEPGSFVLPTIDEVIGEKPIGSVPVFPDEINLRAPPANVTPAFAEPLPERPTDLQPPRPDDFWESVNFMHDQLSEFDVDEFLADDVNQMVAGFLSSFDDFLGFLADDMDMQFDLNLLEFDLVRFGYIEYLADLKASTLQGEADEQERLREDLDEVISINESNNENTHERLSDFAAMMPESRTQAGMNSGLVDFTVSPFEFVHPDVRQAMLNIEVEQVQDESVRWADIIIISIAALLLILISVVSIIYLRKRKASESG